MKYFTATLIGLSFLTVGCGSSSDTSDPTKSSASSATDSSQALPDFSEGKIIDTNRNLDLVIRGRGFFVVKSSSGEQYFTRAQSFIKDSLGTGVITTRDGYYLQGYAIDEDGKIAYELSNIQVTTLGLDSKARATTALHYSINLDASATSPSTFSGTSFTAAASTSNFNVTTNAYDSLGNVRTLVTYFRKEAAANTWSYHVLTDGSNLADVAGVGSEQISFQEGTHGSVVAALFSGISGIKTNGDALAIAGDNIENINPAAFNSSADLFKNALAQQMVNNLAATTSGFTQGHFLSAEAIRATAILQEGTLTFNSSGVLVDVTANSKEPIQWKDGAPIAGLNFDFGQVRGSASRTTQFATSSAVEIMSQDGRTAGILQSMYIAKNGHVSASFSNGVSPEVYEIPLAIFPNEEGLKLVQGTKDIYVESQASGKSSIAKAKSSGRGWIKSFAIEQKENNKPSASDIGALPDFSQGALKNTTRPTDLAIQGSGFFIVNEPSDETTYFTRTGDFVRNVVGELVLPEGDYALKGYSMDESGNVSSSLSNVSLNAYSNPLSTTAIHYTLNLDAGSATPGAFDGSTFTQAATTSNFNTTINVYDSLGNTRTVVTYFRKDAANSWSYRVLTAGSNLANYTGIAGGTVELAAGELTFDTAGNLGAVTSQITREVHWSNGASSVQGFTLDFGQISGSSYLTNQYSAPSSVTILSQNGRTAGYLVSIEITANGHISGTFSNGSTRDIYEIPLASFPNNEGLKLVEDTKNIYIPTVASGKPAIGEAQTFDRGDIRSFSLEQKD